MHRLDCRDVKGIEYDFPGKYLTKKGWLVDNGCPRYGPEKYYELIKRNRRNAKGLHEELLKQPKALENVKIEMSRCMALCARCHP